MDLNEAVELVGKAKLRNFSRRQYSELHIKLIGALWGLGVALLQTLVENDGVVYGWDTLTIVALPRWHNGLIGVEFDVEGTDKNGKVWSLGVGPVDPFTCEAVKAYTSENAE